MNETAQNEEDGFSRVIICGNKVLAVTEYDAWFLAQVGIQMPESGLWGVWQ